MEKLWSGRFKKPIDEQVNEFNKSIEVDSLMYKEDILGSIAHVKMLKKTEILNSEEADLIENALKSIAIDIENSALKIDYSAEDIHTFIEAELIKRIGEAGKRLHTARSRNDQVALDTKLYIKNKTEEISLELKKLIEAILSVASDNLYTVMAGYTHLQIAQPITFAEHIMAYAFMFKRDLTRLSDCYLRMNLSPLGACALAGTTFNIDRDYTAKLLGFTCATENSVDSVADRDYLLELSSAISIIMTHLSRFCEETVLWCSSEFKYIELDDSYSTGSSIMPQKKNPDIAELIRGKTGRTYGNLITLFTMLKGLPLAYNKDMQEDKEAVFDSVDTVLKCLNIFTKMLLSSKILKENMAKNAEKGFINATDCADYLTKKGMPFRAAYKLTGEIVAYAIEKGKSLNALSITEYKSFSELFEEDLYLALDLKNSIQNRKTEGGPSIGSVKSQINNCQNFLDNFCLQK